MNIEQLELVRSKKRKEKIQKMKDKKTIELNELVTKINNESNYQVVGRYRGRDIENEIMYGYSLERLVLAPKDNLDKIFLTQYAYNNLFKLMKSGGWCIFNPITDFTLTRGEHNEKHTNLLSKRL
jgi:hypothetical protein